MRYHEIITEGPDDGFQQSIMDMLTPIAASGVEYVTFQQVIQKLKTIPSGLHIDRELIMQALDPNQLPLIKKIEGDKIYLNPSLSGPERSVSDQQAEKEQSQIAKTATKQAIKAATQ
jgi:hypothetical protein